MMVPDPASSSWCLPWYPLHRDGPNRCVPRLVSPNALLFAAHWLAPADAPLPWPVLRTAWLAVRQSGRIHSIEPRPSVSAASTLPPQRPLIQHPQMQSESSDFPAKRVPAIHFSQLKQPIAQYATTAPTPKTIGERRLDERKKTGGRCVARLKNMSSPGRRSALPTKLGLKLGRFTRRQSQCRPRSFRFATPDSLMRPQS